MRILEKSVQKALERHYLGLGYAVKREVHTPVGYIDFLLYKDMGLSRYQKILIEVKEAKSVKHAVGQVYSYRKYHPDVTSMRIVYFSKDGCYKNIDQSFYSIPDITVECVHSFLPLDQITQYQEAKEASEDDDYEAMVDVPDYDYEELNVEYENINVNIPW